MRVNLSPVINKVESSVYYQTVDRLFENYIGIRDSFALDNVSDVLQETAGFELQDDLNLLPVGNTILGVEYEYDQLQTKKDRKSTRLNSSHVRISYAVFC